MKILFIGPMGAGKTTAIAAVSDVPPVTTEAENSDRHQCGKALTTVALDYGEIALPEGDSVALFGIPGQERFSFMWPILAEGAMGAILLINHQAGSPRQQLSPYLDAFADLAARGALVIGVGHAQQSAEQVLPPYRALLHERGLALPLYVTDARQRQSVLLLIESLIATAEANRLIGH